LSCSRDVEPKTTIFPFSFPVFLLRRKLHVRASLLVDLSPRQEKHHKKAEAEAKAKAKACRIRISFRCMVPAVSFPHPLGWL